MIKIDNLISYKSISFSLQSAQFEIVTDDVWNGIAGQQEILLFGEVFTTGFLSKIENDPYGYPKFTYHIVFSTLGDVSKFVEIVVKCSEEDMDKASILSYKPRLQNK